MPITTASVLAFERKLDPSDALFSAGLWDDRAHGENWPTVGVHEKCVRGTISHRQAGQGAGAAKLSGEIESPNPQTVDVATLPNDADTLRVRFTLRVLGGAGTPSACDKPVYRAKLQAMVQAYIDEHGFGELAQRYAINLANGRYLWRNRIGAEQVSVEVRQLREGQPQDVWTFDALAFSLRHFEAPEPARADLAALSQIIEQGLAGAGHVLLEVIAYARLGDGQEVYPSQELILDKGDKRGQKSKTLYSVGGVAALHSQKVGNALRTIDTWYPRGEDDNAYIGPIAVEPYGSVTTHGKAFREPKPKADFYSLLDAWVLKDQPPAEAGNRHFVMATLIRGGVFGESDKD